MELKDSKTKGNLLRAFAGESQARNRYEFAKNTAKKEGLYIIEDLFCYTADQEKGHAQVFYNFLKEFNGENIDIQAAYPIGNYENTLALLKDARHNENEEATNIYIEFANTAREENFMPIATAFDNIASIEKVHSDRFDKYVKYMEEGTLFKESSSIKWMCTFCGYIYEGTEAPKICPVCSHPQGYYMRFDTTQFNIK